MPENSASQRSTRPREPMKPKPHAEAKDEELEAAPDDEGDDEGEGSADDEPAVDPAPKVRAVKKQQQRKSFLDRIDDWLTEKI